MQAIGYNQLVCDIFLNWEDVKDEILLPDRKLGSGNGTVHVFLGAADSALRSEFAKYYTSVEKGEDTTVQAAKIKHVFTKSNVLSMLGYVCQYYKAKGEDYNDVVNSILGQLEAFTTSNGLITTESLFKLSTGSNKLRPYFKQFDEKGAFHKIIRLLLLPNSAYKISLYKNNLNEYAAFWLIGFSELNDFEADSSKAFLQDTTIVNGETCHLQQIFYGAPGTGKSYTINRDTAGEDVIRTTFHPDTDYSTFVGAYKPTTIEEEVMTVIGTKAVPVENADGTHRKESKIVYEFVQQSFLQAYVAAWKKYAETQDGEPRKQFLVIEEINRGNCAQIFGDLFQLLDRNAHGFSDYPITADADMKRQLKKAFAGLTLADGDNINAMYNGRNVCQEVLEGDILLLPNNLYIWATMNTSDQSLFPIDSAFKRRWDWQYMPISEGRDKNGQSKNWKIEADTQMYSWWSFIQKINDEIYDKTYSEDKELGYYFCKPINDVIKVETFVSKVLFYLWNDVFKDFDNESGIFAEPYDKFYGTDTKGEVVIAKDKVQTLLDNLHVEVAEIIGADENESASDESDNTTKTGSSARDKSVYAINGEGNYVKKNVPLATVTAYVKNYPDVTASELVETWYALGTMVRQIVISKESYEQKLSKTSDANFATRYDSLNLPNGEVVYVYNQFTPERINDFISKVNEQSWDIHIKKVSE